MTRRSTIAAIALSALALAACGSSSSHSKTTKTSAAASTPASTAATAAASSTPASTTSSTQTATSTSATSTAATPTGGASVAAFKSALIAEKKAGSNIGTALVRALQSAGSMSNSTFAATFGALGAQFAQYASAIGKIQAPPQFKAGLAGVARGYATLAADVTSLSKSATPAQSRARTLKLASDIRKLQAQEKTFGKAVGIP